MAGVTFAKLLLLCIIAQTTQSHPNWFYAVTNPQITVIRCSTDFLWKYGTICVKFPTQWNTTNPAPAPPTQNPAQPPDETPPSPGESPPPATPPAEEPATTSSLIEIVNPPTSVVERGRRRRGIHLGPEFSLALPPLKPPLSLNFPPFVQTPPAPPPATVVVQCCFTGN